MIQNRFAGYAFPAEKYHLNVIPNREIHQLACNSLTERLLQKNIADCCAEQHC